jgi:hypothetical protein
LKAYRKKEFRKKELLDCQTSFGVNEEEYGVKY